LIENLKISSFCCINVTIAIKMILRDEKINELKEIVTVYFFRSGITLCCNFLLSVSWCVWPSQYDGATLEVKRNTWTQS